jgi:hypothetical protein
MLYDKTEEDSVGWEADPDELAQLEEPWPVHYWSSSGNVHLIREMHEEHLKNAIRKILRRDADWRDNPVLRGLTREYSRRRRSARRLAAEAEKAVYRP